MNTLCPRPRLAVLGLVLALGTACAGSGGDRQDPKSQGGSETLATGDAARLEASLDETEAGGGAPAEATTPDGLSATASGAPGGEGERGDAQGGAPPVIATPIPSERPNGPQAPDFKLTLLDGKPIELQDFAGKVLLIDFWATWCGPCRMSIPHLIELQKELGESGFAVLGVSLDQMAADQIRPFVERSKINYPIAMGNAGIVRAYGGPEGIRAIPMAFLVDREGYVATVIRGYRPKADLEGLIRPLLASRSDGDSEGNGDGGAPGE